MDEYTPLGLVDKYAPKCFSEVDVKKHAPFGKRETPKQK